nr:MAG TPA: hypothetical protein [Caudoviricetes sp.]
MRVFFIRFFPFLVFGRQLPTFFGAPYYRLF